MYTAHLGISLFEVADLLDQLLDRLDVSESIAVLLSSKPINTSLEAQTS